MGRLLVALLLLNLAGLAQLKEREASGERVAPLVEEDEDIVAPPEYVFNPIQAEKDLKIGEFYAKKGNHRAAAGRYLEATKWNPGFAEAYWKLGRSREKLKQTPQALDAYRKYVELEPDGKLLCEARKRIAELEAQQEKLPLTHDAAKKNENETSQAADKSQP